MSYISTTIIDLTSLAARIWSRRTCKRSTDGSRPSRSKLKLASADRLLGVDELSSPILNEGSTRGSCVRLSRSQFFLQVRQSPWNLPCSSVIMLDLSSLAECAGDTVGRSLGEIFRLLERKRGREGGEESGMDRGWLISFNGTSGSKRGKLSPTSPSSVNRLLELAESCRIRRKRNG